MKEFVVFYAVAGAMQAKKVEAANVSEAACALVRMVPEAIVMGYPREVLFVPRVAVVRDCEEFA